MVRGFGLYNGYGMMGGGWLGLLIMGLIWVLVITGIVVLVLWLVRRASGRDGMSGHTPSPPSVAAHDEAVAIVRKRLATGEITQEQFDELMKTLG
jgi:putative membrane protein